jgi:hypothetical protein
VVNIRCCDITAIFRPCRDCDFAESQQQKPSSDRSHPEIDFCFSYTSRLLGGAVCLSAFLVSRWQNGLWRPRQMPTTRFRAPILIDPFSPMPSGVSSEDKDCATINPTVPPQHVGREYVNLETGLNVPFSRPALGIGDFYTLPHPPEKH